MNKKSFFVVLLAMLCLAVFTVSVYADQLANDRWCNSDQYGCWVTGDDGAQDYIMFWSESAREYFMGPGSNAPVVEQYTAGKMPLDPAPAEKHVRTWIDALNHFFDLMKEYYGGGEYYVDTRESAIHHYNRMINNGWYTESEVEKMYDEWSQWFE
ncbi:MAG: hypothetical protein IJI57_01955 [Flexilinea sp.]|nr:hypothetical protein [Flexilinea sp.]